MNFKEKFVVLIRVYVFFVQCVQAESGGRSQNIEIESRIFGVEKLSNEEFELPWLVALHHRFYRSFFCSGSLISEKHVLSGKS